MPALTPEPSWIELLFQGASKCYDKWEAAERQALERQTDEELQQHMSTYDVNAWRALDVLIERQRCRTLT